MSSAYETTFVSYVSHFRSFIYIRKIIGDITHSSGTPTVTSIQVSSLQVFLSWKICERFVCDSKEKKITNQDSSY